MKFRFPRSNLMSTPSSLFSLENVPLHMPYMLISFAFATLFDVPKLSCSRHWHIIRSCASRNSDGFTWYRTVNRACVKVGKYWITRRSS